MATSVAGIAKPTVREITDRAFSIGLFLASDGEFYEGRRNSRLYRPLSYEKIRPFLTILRAKYAEYMNCDMAQINYEDIFYFCRTLINEIGTRRNPAFGSFIEQLEREITEAAIPCKYIIRPTNIDHAIRKPNIIHGKYFLRNIFSLRLLFSNSSLLFSNPSLSLSSLSDSASV